nr:hypothetical protein [Kibdelosporangium sp. MJ126-NF4]CEL14841.1 hypothetical protein [Kibdelosporangium sp. MJ126-NF4]CTQ96528.1 hypothetical protein [Kibdelosporangium sp. MJ126-NF4]
MAEEFQTGQSGPAQQQVETEVAVAQVSQAIAGMFGGEYNHQSGGGGAGGHYEFTSLAELDSIITELKTMADSITLDGESLDRARSLITPPADDIMSTLQTKITVFSLTAAFEHNRAMCLAAEAEISKLVKAREAYAQAENHGAQTFRMRG